MRDETTFLPPRTSTTSSIGISTRPILSCKLKAATRLSRLSLTFFSKPEYVWMMYHCMLMDRWSFFNSGFVSTNPETLYPLLGAKSLQQIAHCPRSALLDEIQINRKKRYGRQNYSGRRNHFFAARPGDFLHFHAGFLNEVARVLHRPGDLLCQL